MSEAVMADCLLAVENFNLPKLRTEADEISLRALKPSSREPSSFTIRDDSPGNILNSEGTSSEKEMKSLENGGGDDDGDSDDERKTASSLENDDNDDDCRCR